LVGKISQLAPAVTVFRSFAGLARTLKQTSHRTANSQRAKKGSFTMSGQSHLTRTLVAAFGALLMSTVAVGAAVGPAQAIASPVSTYNA
jgi:hypothetical protein